MYKLKVILNNKAGLHARPASMFVQEASKYECNIKVMKDNNECNAKSIMGVLSLGAVKGEELMIKAEGKDEKEAVKALKNLIDSNFGE